MSKHDGITVRRLHWYAAAPWRARFWFAFSEGLRPVTLIADSASQARKRAARLRCAMVIMRDRGEL